MSQRREAEWCYPLLALSLLALGALTCGTSAEQAALKTRAAQAGQTVAAEAKKFAETKAAEAKWAVETEAAELKGTAVAAVATELAKRGPSPWDVGWIPSDSERVAAQIDGILEGTGLAGQGAVILQNAQAEGVNPAFGLAMFRKEAIFAAPGSAAYNDKNPANVIATGECVGLAAGSGCHGVYGEIGTDGRFGVYATMADGVEAYFSLLSAEYNPGTGRNCADISCIITAYCPPPECDTSLYVSEVTGWTRQYQLQILAP